MKYTIFIDPFQLCFRIQHRLYKANNNQVFEGALKQVLSAAQLNKYKEANFRFQITPKRRDALKQYLEIQNALNGTP